MLVNQFRHGTNVTGAPVIEKCEMNNNSASQTFDSNNDQDGIQVFSSVQAIPKHKCCLLNKNHVHEIFVSNNGRR